MTAFDEDVLQLAMGQVQAWEQLNDREYSGSLGMEAFEDLLIRAGYSEEASHKAAMQRGWDRLSAGVTI